MFVIKGVGCSFESPEETVGDFHSFERAPCRGEQI
jgi:hypothetical protein